MATNLASCEAIWICKLLTGLFGRDIELTMIHYDNESCIKLSGKPVFHDRSTHIDIRYHFIRDIVYKGVVQLQYIPADKQLENIFTKPLEKGKFVPFRAKLGVVENTFLTKREC
jgi:hypothetical protein